MVRSLVVALAALCLTALTPRRATTGVHLIGDSTMADKPTPETNPERGWGQLLPRYLDDRASVHNHALNGRSTKSFIDEGTWSTVRAELKLGDYVFIQFSHNDEKQADSTRYTDPATTFRRNLERFVRESRDKGAIPVLFTPIVRRKFSATGTLEDTHGAYPDAVRAVATALAVPLIDMQTLTADLVRGAGVEGSKRLYVWVDPGTSAMYPEGRQDDTHLSVEGATAVAKLAARAIKKSGLPIAAFVRNVD